MRRPAAWAILGAAIVTIVAVAAVSSARAQTEYPIFTHDHFEGMMKTLGPNLAGVNASLADDDLDTAKARLVLVRQQLATTITFWRDRERDDAIGFLRAAIGRVDALDDALSQESIDPAAVTATAAEIGAACQTCHDVYREQDTATGRISPEAGLGRLGGAVCCPAAEGRADDEGRGARCPKNPGLPSSHPNRDSEYPSRESKLWPASGSERPLP